MAREDDGLADDVLHEGTDVSGMIGDAISSWAVRRPPVASEVDGEHAEGACQCLHDWAVALGRVGDAVQQDDGRRRTIDRLVVHPDGVELDVAHSGHNLHCRTG